MIEDLLEETVNPMTIGSNPGTWHPGLELSCLSLETQIRGVVHSGERQTVLPEGQKRSNEVLLELGWSRVENLLLSSGGRLYELEKSFKAR